MLFYFYMKHFLVLLLLICIVYAFQLEKKSISIDISVAKIELGHYLFFEKRLSKTLSKSCSSCHDPKFAFTDGYRKPLGVYADELAHNAPSLINAMEYKSLNWANPELHDFEKQMLRPLFGKRPVEMGNDENDISMLKQFSDDTLYQRLYRNAFSEKKDIFTWQNTIIAIAEYVKTLRSKNALYDNFLAQKTRWLPLQKDGYNLFFSTKTKCYTCHKGDFFSDSKFYKINKISKEKIRTPSLRNVALTSPYMHDGSVATLTEAVDICQQYKSKKKLTTLQKTAIVNFLYTLTDSTISKNPLFNDPFQQN
jgi:cytochrome c peroxidase